MDSTFTPAITPTTKTLDLCNEIVVAVQGGARAFRLGRFTARWATDGEDSWAVHDGCETRSLFGGLVFGIAPMLRCWLADNWDI